MGKMMVFSLGPMCALLLFGQHNALAKVSATKAAQLGSSLTPQGAKRKGNASGSIPPWTGGIKKAPKGYRPGTPHPDPFATDRVQFTIAAANAAKYRENLSAGQIALLKKYPKFQMRVYPTRRSASFPAYVDAATKKNATRATLADRGNGVANAIIGVPFPIPNNGLEAIWNALLHYRGLNIRRLYASAVVTAGGNYYIGKVDEAVYFPYAKKGFSPADLKNIFFYLRRSFRSPTRLAGTIILVHETINQVKEQRHAWIYTPGLRRVRRAPEISYDSPRPSSDGLSATDQYDMFNGAPNRYTWKLLGKHEIYVPYNAYRLGSGQVDFKSIIKPQHIDTRLARYELHRVWKVEATLKKGQRHIYARRVFYLDEDSWQPLVVDNFDGKGKIWRVQEGHAINYYEAPLIWTALETIYDLNSRRYMVVRFNDRKRSVDFSASISQGDFSPSGLRRRGVR